MSIEKEIAEFGAELVKLAPALLTAFGGNKKAAIAEIRKLTDKRRKARDERVKKKFRPRA